LHFDYKSKNEHETWTIYLMWTKPPFLGWNEVEGFWVKQKVKTWGEMKMFKHIESVKRVGVKGRIPLSCKFIISVQNLWIKVWRVRNLVQIGLCLDHWKVSKNITTICNCMIKTNIYNISYGSNQSNKTHFKHN